MKFTLLGDKPKPQLFSNLAPRVEPPCPGDSLDVSEKHEICTFQSNPPVNHSNVWITVKSKIHTVNSRGFQADFSLQCGDRYRVPEYSPYPVLI